MSNQSNASAPQATALPGILGYLRARQATAAPRCTQSAETAKEATNLGSQTAADAPVGSNDAEDEEEQGQDDTMARICLLVTSSVYEPTSNSKSAA